MSLSPENEAPTPTMRIATVPLHEDIGERLRRLGNPQANLTKGLSAIDFYRMLAKIGHAFATAAGGAFKPELLPLILDGNSARATYFIGGDEKGGNPEGQLHSIGITDHASLVVARIRLFAHIPDTPVYYVVCGEKARCNLVSCHNTILGRI